MTKFRAVLVLPLDKQDNSDGRYIDPNGVTFDDEMDYPIFREFSYNDLPVGHGRISRAEDGSLVIDGELDAKVADKLAIGVTTTETVRHKNRVVIPRSEVFTIGITDHHADRNQPPLESLDS